jgi:hypothetical protein
VGLAEQAATLEPLREASQLLLVEALAASGDQAGALVALAAFRERLAAELGLDPSPRAAELERRVLRVAHVAAIAVLFDRLGGPEVAVATVQRRSGRSLDPGLAEAFARVGRGLLAELDAGDVRTALLAAEPEPRRVVDEADVDRIAAAFGDLVDLKSPSTLGHAGGVAALAEAAARELRLDTSQVTCLRRAGLLHDLGRAGVPSGIWDRPGR